MYGASVAGDTVVVRSAEPSASNEPRTPVNRARRTSLTPSCWVLYVPSIEFLAPTLELDALCAWEQVPLSERDGCESVRSPRVDRQGRLGLPLLSARRSIVDRSKANELLERHQERTVTARHRHLEHEPLPRCRAACRRHATGGEGAFAGDEAAEHETGGPKKIKVGGRGATRTRTAGLFHAMEALYHLSYSPVGPDSSSRVLGFPAFAHHTHVRYGTPGV